MIYMKYWYKILFFFHKTVFRKNQRAGLTRNIDGFSFEEINDILKGMKVTIIKKTDRGFKAKYNDIFTEYVLSFDKLGIGQKIESEYWKEIGVKFEDGK